MFVPESGTDGMTQNSTFPFNRDRYFDCSEAHRVSGQKSNISICLKFWVFKGTQRSC